MNRKRALFWYEMGNLKWFLLGGLLLGGFLLLAISSELSFLSQSAAMSRSVGWAFEGSPTFGQVLLQAIGAATPFAVLLLGVMSGYQFSDYHKRNKREFILSLPFTQRERFLMKGITGFGVITVVWLVFSIGVSALRAVYYPQIIRNYLIYPEYKIIMANDTWLHMFRTLMLLWLIVLTAYAVYMLVHSVVLHGVLGLLVTIGTMAAPAWVLLMFSAYTEVLAGDSAAIALSRWFGHHATFTRLCAIFGGMGYYQNEFLLSSAPYKENDMVGSFQLISYGYMTKLFVALSLILILILVLSWFINTRQDGARCGRLVPLKPVRIILAAGIAVCFGLGITWIFMMIFEIESFAFVFLILAVICMGLFMLTDKILKKVVR